MRARSLALLAPLLVACAGTPPASPPLSPGAFVAPCPPTPNCVSTAAPPEDVEHFAAPLVYTGDLDAAKARMKAIVAAMPRAALVEETETSLRFTFTSALLRFVDDVHVVFVPAEGGGRVEYRSASRVGRGDMGVNRARMDAIAAAWAEGGAAR